MRTSVAIAIACLPIGVCLAADAAAAMRRATNIPGQSLDSALQFLAKDRNLQMIYPYAIVGESYTDGVHGELTFDEALTQLLRGTKLTYRFLDEKTVTIIELPSSPPATQGLPAAASGMGDTAPPSDAFAGLLNRFRLAQAQTSAVENSSDVASTTDGSGKGASGLDEIVVTAQKREERLQNVPVSIAVLAGERLDRSSFDGVREVLNTVPGVAITTNQNMSPTITVRGVSATVARLGGAGVIGYYVDSIPYAMVKHALIPDTSAYDLERVEVLRGPQGTLYGASSLNGVVRILAKDADPSAFEFKARGLTSSTEGGDMSYRGDAAINVPLVQDKLAARLTVSRQAMGGWIDRIGRDNANESDSSSVRLKVNAQPTEQLSLGATAWRSRINNDGTNVSDDHGFLPNVRDQPNEDNYDSYGVRAAYDFAAFTLSSMTSYIESRVESNLDTNLYGFPNQILSSSFENRSFAEELLLTSTHGGSWRWTLGAMYRDAKDTTWQTQGPPAAILNDQDDISKSKSVFGELTRLFLDGRFELTGGLRHFDDEVTIHDRLQAGTTVSRTVKFNKVSPRVVLTWHPGSDLTAYASYSEGFRSGSHQLGAAARAGLGPVKPDNLTNYEIGAKGDLMNGRVSFDSAIYYIDWQDVQRQVAIPVTINGVNTFPSALVNGQSASGPGIDLGVTLRPTDRLTLSGGVGYSDLKIDADVVSVTAAATILVARKGDRLQASPELTASASGDYRFPIGRYAGRFSASANYVSKNPDYQYNPAIQSFTHDSILIGRTSLSLESDAHWTASLYVDNVNNEQGRVFQPGVSAIATTGVPVAVNYTRPRPRTVGLQVDYQF